MAAHRYILTMKAIDCMHSDRATNIDFMKYIETMLALNQITNSDNVPVS